MRMILANREKEKAKSNPLKALHDEGQAVWLDFLSRRFLIDNGLKQLIEHDGLTGVTSNPSIFEKAIAESKDYDTSLRFLHSTGQAYKGGPNEGVFLQVTCDARNDLPIPGHNFSFGAVIAAQARVDFSVLSERKRRAIRVHLGADVEKGLKHLNDALQQALL